MRARPSHVRDGVSAAERASTDLGRKVLREVMTDLILSGNRIPCSNPHTSLLSVA